MAEAVADYARPRPRATRRSRLPGDPGRGRKAAARLLNCQTDEVAFVGPTSLALSFFASGLKFRKNDNILIYFDDYPSNVYPWMALAEQGVEVRLMNTRGLGVIRPRDVMGQVDENTRLVALASCHFISGYRIDIEAIGKYLREREILFCLDAIQTLGAFPTTVAARGHAGGGRAQVAAGPVRGGDHVCAAGRCRSGSTRRFTAGTTCGARISWRRSKSTCGPGAHVYEAGTCNLLGIVGLEAAMDAARGGRGEHRRGAAAQTAWLVPGAASQGLHGVTCRCAAAAFLRESSAFIGPEPTCLRLHAKLTEANIVTSLRTDRADQKYIRLSPHFYNTDVELHRVYRGLALADAGGR